MRSRRVSEGWALLAGAPMSLVTRCPACGTAFRVQREQLAAHSGTVRCGKCGSVFDGVAALVEEGAERCRSSRRRSSACSTRRPAGARRARRPTTAAAAIHGPPSRPRAAVAWALAVLAVAMLARKRVPLSRRCRSRPAAGAARGRVPARLQGGAAAALERPEHRSSDLQADPRRAVIVLNAVHPQRARFRRRYPGARAHADRRGGRPLRRVLRRWTTLEPRAPRRHRAAARRSAARLSRRRAASRHRLRLYLFYPA